MKKTKKQRSKTFPSIGNVSNNNITKIRIDGTRLMARNGRRTRTVRIADKLRLSPGRRDSISLNQATKLLSRIIDKQTNKFSPRNNNKTIQTIPCISEISSFTKYSHSCHFNTHFNSKKSEYKIIYHL